MYTKIATLCNLFVAVGVWNVFYKNCSFLKCRFAGLCGIHCAHPKDTFFSTPLADHRHFGGIREVCRRGDVLCTHAHSKIT